jgi:hypothetical protein
LLNFLLVQAEKKEADDALGKAQYDHQITQEQIKLAWRDALEQSRSIVQKARREASRIREDARTGGIAAGVMESQTLLQTQVCASLCQCPIIQDADIMCVY